MGLGDERNDGGYRESRLPARDQWGETADERQARIYKRDLAWTQPTEWPEMSVECKHDQHSACAWPRCECKCHHSSEPESR